MVLMFNTENLLLRPIRDTDIEHVFMGLSHPDVIRYYGVSFSSLEETKVQMQWYATLEKEKTGQWWAICDPDDQSFYGAIGLNDIQSQHQRAEIGFWLLPEYWGKGFVTEAALAVCKCGFMEMGLHRIYAYVESENKSSVRVLQQLQFVSEGTLKECEWKNDKWIDLEVYARLNGETVRQ